MILLLVRELSSRAVRDYLSSHFSRNASEFAQWRGRLRVSPVSLLLFLLSCYIVCSRLGPVVSRAGHLAIEAFEVERRILEEFDQEGLRLFREVFGKFRTVTRAPYPIVLFGRSSDDNLLQVTMGNWTSKSKNEYQPNPVEPTDQSGAAPDQSGAGAAVKKEVADLTGTPPEAGEGQGEGQKREEEGGAGKEEGKEEGKEGGEEGGREGEEGAGKEEGKEGGQEGGTEGEEGGGAGKEEGKEGGEGEEGGGAGKEGGREEGEEGGQGMPEKSLPNRQVDRLRKDSEFTLRSMGSTESLAALGEQDRLDPADYTKPIKFKVIQPTIRTGDLALLYRRGQGIPNVAIFINHSDCDPLFPLLLVKGKTKPLSLEKFRPNKPRFIHPITATTRIFYGDYDKVAVQYLETDTPISVEDAMKAIDEVERIPFSLKEQAAIRAAKSDVERSLIICTFMAAYYYKRLGVFQKEPNEVTPATFRDHLNLRDPIYVRLPSVKFGPMVHGEPPFLKQLVDGIYPPANVKTVSYDEAVKGLDTGDLVFFTGATSQGAIIKFFDHSQFSHIALVLKAKYTSQLLLWEASTNHAKLVDVQSGHVQTGVEVLPLRNKIFSGWYDRVAVRRLLNFTREDRERLYKIMLQLRKEWMGRPYEKSMVQLAVSAINPSDVFLSLFQNKEEDLSSLFCSELVAAAYQRMGLIKNDRPSNSYTPDDFSSSRDHKILCEGVQLSPEEYINLKFPPTLLSTQESVY